ncbi:MAG: thioredoxin [Nanoarchaeota archaeon]|nr:thioredoxin [Nanoarchaeota archaeon]
MDITEKNFKEKVIKKSNEKPILVDFWAEWCGPCRSLTPVLEKLSEERSDFILAKVDVEKHGKLAGEYEVMSIPSVKLFKGGSIIAEFIGSKSEAEVNAFLDKNL